MFDDRPDVSAFVANNLLVHLGDAVAQVDEHIAASYDLLLGTQIRGSTQIDPTEGALPPEVAGAALADLNLSGVLGISSIEFAVRVTWRRPTVWEVVRGFFAGRVAKGSWVVTSDAAPDAIAVRVRFERGPKGPLVRTA